MATNNQTNVGLSGASGTGSFAGTTSPTFVTPVLGVASATSITFGGGTLNTYAENTSWTPVLTFVTPGDVSVSYSTQTGKYSRIGNIVVAEFVLVCTPTYTTAAGNLNISGLPFTIGSAAYGSVHFQSSTFPAGTTSLFLRGSAGGTVILIGASGSAVAVAFMSVTQLLTGVAVNIQGTITYLV